MTNIIFVEPDGAEHLIEADNGDTLMDAAVNNLVPGILGECGGACICATCHVVTSPEWASKLSPPNDKEKMMLEGVMDITEESRLGCQITIDDSLDGLKVFIPEAQY